MALNLESGTMAGDAAGRSDPPPVPTIEDLAPRFPQLEIVECLGRGGMGVVYKARQKSLDRFVALKLLAPEREKDAKFAARFAREAKALAKLNHPNIVTIHDFGEAGGLFYLLMEFVDGVNLRQAMAAGSFTPEQALAVVPPVCEALQFAHDAGIVHRDIKPENLLIDKAGTIKIADFGIARMLASDGDDDVRLGTPRYMAPEQRGGKAVADHRADIYALGVVLYEMLTGQAPAADLLAPSRQALQIDVRLDEVVLRALEAEPGRRYQSAAEFGTAVQMVAAAPGAGAGAGAVGTPSVRNPWSRRLVWLGGVFVAFLSAFPILGIGAWLAAREGGSPGPMLLILLVFGGVVAGCFFGARALARRCGGPTAKQEGSAPKVVFIVLSFLLLIPMSFLSVFLLYAFVARASHSSSDPPPSPAAIEQEASDPR